MEDDKSTAQGPPEANNFPHDSIEGGENGGRLRIKGPKVDVGPLRESITFPFSGRTAKNRFLKAPMTESTKTKVYVTGGFRTASGMARAIRDDACDGVGIGRPLGAEPYLCREILAGRVTGSIENFVPLPQNTQATGTQLHQIGHGHELISDWSDEDEVQRWVEACENQTQRKKALLPKVDSSGYPMIQAQRGFAYVR